MSMMYCETCDKQIDTDFNEQMQTFLYEPEKEVIRYIANELAVRFSHANPKFDSKRFLVSCGVIEGKE